MPWSSRNAPGAVATAQGLRQFVGNVLRLAEDHLGDEGPVDEFGFDPEFSSRYLMPVARFFYQRWFRVQIRGLEHVPAEGPALVVANHSGTLPMDAVMLQAGLYDEHPAHRNLRLLGADLVYEVPLLSALARKGGHIPAARRTPTRCCGPANWSASSPRASRASASRSPSGITCSGSAAAGSPPLRSGTGCRSSPARSSGPRRSTR